jgi:hypothetical protein
MRPVSMFANGPGGEIEQLEADLHGRWRQAARAVIVLLSARALPPAQIAALLDCHPATVRRWISRFNDEGAAGLADRPRCGRPRLGAAACAGQLDGARRPPAGSHPAEEPAGHRIRRTRGDHRRIGVPAGPPLRGGLHRAAGPAARYVPRRPGGRGDLRQRHYPPRPQRYRPPTWRGTPAWSCDLCSRERANRAPNRACKRLRASSRYWVHLSTGSAPRRLRRIRCVRWVGGLFRKHPIWGRNGWQPLGLSGASRSGAVVGEAGPVGDGCCLGAAGGVEFGQDVRHMDAGGLCRDEELGGDVTIAAALADQA